MKANELRIGNYVKFWNNILCVEELNGTIVKASNDEFGSISELYEEINPIPLTVEIYRKIEKQLIRKGFSYGFQNGKITLYLSDEWELESEFLHQLQNLYFALTGQELAIVNPIV